MEEKILLILENMQRDISGIKDEITGMKGEITGIKDEITGIKDEITGMKGEITEIKGDITSIRLQQQEDHIILKALEHASQVQKAEMDKLTHTVAKIEGDVKAIKNDLTTVEYVTGKNMSDIAQLKAVR